MRHIGVFGGSFNPVHRGHIIAADSARMQLELDEVRFLPAAHSPFKTRSALSDAHRIDMLKRAIEGHPAFKIDTQELLRSGPSYTLDTLTAITNDRPGDRLYLLIGMDAWQTFEFWHQWQTILELGHLVVLSRPGYSPSALSEYWREKMVTGSQELKNSTAGRLMFVTVPASKAASNTIREQIQQGLDVSDDLPGSVHNYILEHQLYR